MPEINYKQLPKHLQKVVEQTDGSGPAQVYLIHGEETLCKLALDQTLQCLLPEDSRSLNYKPYEGRPENVQAALESINTFSLLAGKKVVALIDAQIFSSRQDSGQLLLKARKYYEDNKLEQAATAILTFLSLNSMKLTDEDQLGKIIQKKLPGDIQPETDWVHSIIAHCRKRNLEVPSSQQSSALLEAAMEKGFPDGNHLVITVDQVDKRRKLYKSIERHGLVIDCSVPKGSRMADEKARVQVMQERLHTILTTHNKEMDKTTRETLFERVGFDLRTLSNSLEKLVHYVGERSAIQTSDVQTVLERTRQDPIYALTNAVADQAVSDALFYLSSLLTEGLHPLQILAGIVNQTRRLLVAKDTISQLQPNQFQAGMPYNRFCNTILPQIQKEDQAFLDSLKAEQGHPKDTSTDQGSAKKRTRKPTASSDLVLVKNPNSPFPVYQLFKKAASFSRDHLEMCMDYLLDADRRLKSGSVNPRLILEECLFYICQHRQEPLHAER